MPERAPAPALNPSERRTVGVLAAVFSVRMLGLFMLLPVLALHARELTGATPLLVGLSVGAYGITQALLQIPFGFASDRIGRKPVIVGGLALFALGSLIAAASVSAPGLVAGRALQGAGAISAAVTALLADSTRFEIRTRAMAFFGVAIGGSFVVSLVLGPALAGLIGVRGLFVLTALLAALCAALVATALPRESAAERASPISGAALRAVAPRPDLLELDLGVFLLHLVLTATFVAVPLGLRDDLGLPQPEHWRVYLAAMAVSLTGTIPLVLAAERVRHPRRVTVAALAVLVAGLVVLARPHRSLLGIGAGLALFFAALNYLEARLPALLSRAASGAARGAAMGVYASAQFLGAFAGGTLAGWLLGASSVPVILWTCAALSAGWLAFTLRGYRGPEPG